MSWHGVLGHDQVFERFRRAVRHRRLASTFLFVGPSGVGKRLVALKLAQALSCEVNPEERLEACGRCPSCQQVAAGTHPDVQVVGKPDDKSFIPVEVFIGDREHRLREGLCYTLGMRPMLGRRRIAIIDDADYLNEAGANCLLKTLEEPPAGSMLILLGTSQQKQLPTIRSRCQTVRFAPLPAEVVARLLLQQEPTLDPQEASRVAELSGGSLDRARDLIDQELKEFRTQFLEALEQGVFPSLALAKETVVFVESISKEAKVRRGRFRQVLGFAVDFYQQLMRHLSGHEVEGDERLRQAIARAATRWAGDGETAAECVERCLEALSQVERNAQVTTIIDAWLDDLGQLAAGRIVRNAAGW